MRISKILPGYAGIQGYLKDFIHDFATTISEVAGDNTLPQALAAGFLTAIFHTVVFVIWAVLSFFLGGVVFFLWNWVGWLPSMGYWESYCLTLLSFVLFRGPVIHLTDGGNPL